MSTTVAPPPQLAGDICPPWCGGEHTVDRDEKTHVADRGVWHHSLPIDTWTGIHPDGDEPIVVRIMAYRHDEPGHPDGPDLSVWFDEVTVDGDVYPAFSSSVQLPAVDARRLGEALIKAADLMERRA